jgi:hypothetical protein
MPVSADHDHSMHAVPRDEAMTTAALPAELPLVLVEGQAPTMGSHLAMACVAILVGLLLLAAGSLRPFRKQIPRSGLLVVRRPVLWWPPPPDPAQLSILRT